MTASRKPGKKWVAAVCLAGAAMAGCTDTATSDARRPTEHRADGPAQTAQDSSAHCGVDAPPDSERLLSLGDVYPATAGTKSLSTRVNLLTTAGCGSGQGFSGAVGTSCRAADFPWTSSPVSQDEELYASGARLWAEATFTGPRNRVLREYVAVPDAKTKDTFIAHYRNHLEKCGAESLGLQNDVPTEFGLKGSPSLVVSFENGRMTVLEGVGPSWKSQDLQGLLGTAVSRSATFAPS